jgi:hypothetical protein
MESEDNRGEDSKDKETNEEVLVYHKVYRRQKRMKMMMVEKRWRM